MDTVKVVGGMMLGLLMLTRNFEVRQASKAHDKQVAEAEYDSALLFEFVK